MNQRPQARPAQTAAVISTPVEARKLAEGLSGLLGVIERETELVRAGKLHEAMQLEVQKSEHSRRYTLAVESLKNSQAYLAQVSPELLTTLRRHHDTFRAMLQINLTVLATAHAVSEGIVRGVSNEMQRRSMPNTYTATGARTTPGPRNHAPLSISRSL